jgi:archaeosine synthase beta-subunit
MNQETLDRIVGGINSDGLTGELRTSTYSKAVSELQRFIHSRIPESQYDTTRVASDTSIREEIFEGKNYKRAVVYLLSNGCEWALNKAHGCTMCGHLAKQTRTDRRITPQDHIRQFREESKKLDFKDAPLLNIFNNGSFFNDNEIDPLARTEILKMISANRDIKMLVLETRPEYVNEEKINEVKRLVPDLHVEIAIGFELKNDTYRSICLNKGFSLETYNRAAEIITKQLNLRSYVFLKPPFLTEKESIDETVATVEHAFNVGSTTVSLEACTIQDYTLTKYLYDAGLYIPPRLWSILEVIKRSRQANHGNKLIVGLFQFYPSPQSVPQNCPLCSETVMEGIRQYNRTLDALVLNELHCDCKAEWRNQLKKESTPFEKRLETALVKIKSKWMEK